MGDGSSRTECIFKYHGFDVMAGKQIYLVDFETLHRNELTFRYSCPNTAMRCRNCTEC